MLYFNDNWLVIDTIGMMDPMRFGDGNSAFVISQRQLNDGFINHQDPMNGSFISRTIREWLHETMEIVMISCHLWTHAEAFDA